jgi:HlyD family secretion protein
MEDTDPMPQTLEREQHQDLTQALFGAHAPAPPVPPPVVKRRRWVVPAAILAVILAALAIWRVTSKPAVPAWSTARVERGTVAKTISATGKLQATTTVQVGTQVSGTISEIYADFNSRVKKGQVIARLDPSQLQAQLTQAQANLAGAQAGVQTAQAAQLSTDAGVAAAQANVERTDSVLADATRTLERTRDLVTAGVAPRQQLDTAQATVNQAAAQRQQAVAQLNQARAQAQSSRSQANAARAQAAQAAASVQLASVNMDKTIIHAPIDGVIVSRNVDVGQTVAASLQAPTLFLIANDLTSMQVLADIDEADVGQLEPGARVTFTVDAYPQDTFEGRIAQVRLAPQNVQNVVTYTAVIDVANPDLKLKPGMTANVTATVAERKDVLTVPNAALRFRPEGEAPAQPNTRRRSAPQVWRVGDEKKLDPVQIRPGMSDGVKTEVVSGDLHEGDMIAVPVQPATGRAGQAGQRPGGGFPMGGGGRVRMR